MGCPTIRCKPENLVLVVHDDEDEPPDLISSSGEESDHDNREKPVKPPVPPPARAQPPAQPARAPPVASPRVNNESKPKISQSQRQNPKPSPKPDEDSDGPPELVSSSGDEEEPPPSSRQAIPPKPASAPKPAVAAKAGQPAAPVPAPPVAQNRPTIPPAPPIVASVPDKKQQLQKLILKKTEEGRTAFQRYEYNESCQKFVDIIAELIKLTPTEIKEYQYQSHLTRSYTWAAESHLQQGNHVESTTNGKKAVVLFMLFISIQKKSCFLKQSLSQDSWKSAPDPGDFDFYMQANLCCALAAKGQQDYKAACTQLVECETQLKRRW
jgi:hypothetical protein